MALTKISHLSNTQKVAILMVGLGDEIAADILKQMSEFEVRKVVSAMQHLGRVDKETVDQVFTEFHELLKKRNDFIQGGSQATRNILRHAYKGQANHDLEQAIIESEKARLHSLQFYDPTTLATVIQNEHPQTIAIILAHLSPKDSGETLKLLPESLHLEILNRIAKLDAISQEMVEEIDDFLRQEAHSMGSWYKKKLGGVHHVASILNSIDKSTEEKILEHLETRDPDLTEEIREQMFVFEDLTGLDNRSIQELLKSVSMDIWRVALRNASESINSLVYSNMSSRAAALLKEDILQSPPVKIDEIEKAQTKIIDVARQLEDEGKIVLKQKDVRYV